MRIAVFLWFCIVTAWMLQPQMLLAQAVASQQEASISNLIDQILGPDISNIEWQTDDSDVSTDPADTTTRPSLSDTQQPIEVKLSDMALGVEIPWQVEPDVDSSDHSIRISSNDLLNPPKKKQKTTRKPTSDLDIKLTDQEKYRKLQIQRCLSMFYRMPVDTGKWRPWTIMHGLLPYGQQSRVVHKGKHYNAIEYLCYNAIGNDTHMMHVSNGELALKVGPGVQGHEGQFLAMLAQANAPSDQEIHIQGKQFTVADLIEYEKQGCRPDTELTFKLIGLSHYLDSDTVWRNSTGQSWNIERLIYEELKQPINGAACGGTHRLMGLSYAVSKRQERSKPIDGQWKRAQHFVAQYQRHAMRYQNHDGSFSTNWFVTQESDIDMKKRLYTTGHIIEWLVFSLPQKELTNSRLQRGVDYLLKLMLTAHALDLEIGPRGHALHALRIYEKRVYGANSNVEEISPRDLAIVQKALRMQENMTPSFDSPFGVGLNGNSIQGVSFPGNTNGLSPNGAGVRRGFRRR